MDDGKPSPPAALSDEYLRRHTVGELTPLEAPIRIVEADPDWPNQFPVHAGNIHAALGQRALRIEHAGSTAVPCLPAKPILDILLVVADSSDEPDYAPALEACAYRMRIREPEWHEHRMFQDRDGTINLHVFSDECPEVERMIAFRDWLRTHPDDRDLYAATKRRLAGQIWKYTQNYADAKAAVIEEILSRAGQSGLGI